MSEALISFDGQVAVVTGAGGGMGECFARELARRGASVLVNDYGGDMFGRGGAADPAESVAAAIRASGGAALANADAVGTADAARAIALQALEAFGRIDILINNAGISASGALTAPSDERAEQAFRTNLLGPYHLMRAVWEPMRAQGYGRILNIASNVALGMGGSAAYAASKSGLLGLTFDAAQEGAMHGVHVNALMPTAYSRMIEAVPDPLFVEWMRECLPPEKVAAAALVLVSRDCAVNGKAFSVGGGRMARLAWAEAHGALDRELTPERAHALLGQAMDMSGAAVIESQQAEISLYMEAFPLKDGSKARVLSPDVLATKQARS